jgi:transcriptional regulator with XRE-family HTH domain
MPITEVSPSNGRALRILRNIKGLSQKELAKQVGLAQSKIWQFENNYATPTPEQLAKIFGCLSTE